VRQFGQFVAAVTHNDACRQRGRISECLERAAHFQSLAEAETDAKLRAQLIDQAKAYLRLAGKRAKELGLPPRRAE
jgi:hypothetical protein